MTYGVTDEGFVIKPLDVIEQEIKDKQLADINPALDQTATGPLGQLNGIFSAKVREVWELIEATYNAFNPDSATGASLDNDAALCPGIIRNAATKSTVTARCNLDNGTYAIGELIAHVTGDADARFVSIEGTTVTGGPSNVDLVFEAEETGEVVALSGTLEEIAEPVTGWNSVTNLSDAAVGSPIENDATFRLRREATIRFSGSANVQAIRADVIEVDGVLSAFVVENTSDVIVGGLAPHSVKVTIWDGPSPTADDDEVATAIFLSKAAGIDTNGPYWVSVEDSMGRFHAIYFDRAEEKVLEIRMTAVTDDPPSNWQDADGPLITALTTFVAQDMDIGGDAIYNKLLGVAMDFDWMEDMTTFEIRWAGGSWGTSNKTVADDEIATLDSSDVTFV